MLWGKQGEDNEAFVSSQWTDGEGAAAFTQLAPGRYVLEVAAPGHCHIRTRHATRVEQGATITATLAVYPHYGTRGRPRFVDIRDKPSPTGDISQVVVKPLQGEQVLMQGTKDGPDALGGYWYAVAQPPAPGGYTVRGTYLGQTKMGSVTVSDGCTPAFAGSHLSRLAPGAVGGPHSDVQGPELRFTVQME